MEAYGIEIKEEAARQAQELLGVSQAIYADSYTGIVCTNNVFDVLYLNPPYDTDYSESESRRAEYKALKHHWKYLKAGGVVIWIAYKTHISDKVARFLFENCKAVYPFYWEEPHLETHTQVCLVAIKKHDPKHQPFSQAAVDKAVKHFKAVGAGNLDIKKSRFRTVDQGLPKHRYQIGHKTLRKNNNLIKSGKSIIHGMKKSVISQDVLPLQMHSIMPYFKTSFNVAMYIDNGDIRFNMLEPF